MMIPGGRLQFTTVSSAPLSFVVAIKKQTWGAQGCFGHVVLALVYHMYDPDIDGPFQSKVSIIFVSFFPCLSYLVTLL